jgi:hypothetical protein
MIIVRSTIRVYVGVSIRLGLYVTCTQSLYLPPCTFIYTPKRIQAIQHKILGFYIFHIVSERLVSRRRSEVPPPLSHHTAPGEINLPGGAAPGLDQ